jgi:hypothetical protein
MHENLVLVSLSLQFGGDGEELSAGNAALVNFSRHSVIKKVSRRLFLRHHLISSSSQGSGKLAPPCCGMVAQSNRAGPRSVEDRLCGGGQRTVSHCSRGVVGRFDPQGRNHESSGQPSLLRPLTVDAFRPDISIASDKTILRPAYETWTHRLVFLD